MTQARRQRGSRATATGTGAEDIAAGLLIAEGWAVLARRARTPAGEIDLIAEREGLLAFVEVKARPSLAEAAHALGPRQRARLGKFLLTQMAAVAELEAGLIGQRTKAALAASKARGKTLGGVRPGQRLPTPEERLAGSALGAEKKRRVAVQSALGVAKRLGAIMADGASLATAARTLQAEGVKTPRGGAWTATAVRRVLARTREA